MPVVVAPSDDKTSGTPRVGRTSALSEASPAPRVTATSVLAANARAGLASKTVLKSAMKKAVASSSIKPGPEGAGTIKRVMVKSGDRVPQHVAVAVATPAEPASGLRQRIDFSVGPDSPADAAAVTYEPGWWC
jgi:hypothetical protein